MTDDAFYSPERIDGFLRRWDELLALAESPKTARHLTTRECRPGHACSYGSPVGIRDSKGHHHDALAYADVVSDIEAAWSRLPYNSLGWRTVQLRMLRAGITARDQDGQRHNTAQLDDIARAIGARADDVRHAYREAIKTMARFLGYREEDAA